MTCIHTPMSGIPDRYRKPSTGRAVWTFFAVAMFVVMPWMVEDGLADTTPALSDEALIAALREGGYNLYFRHEATNWSQSDKVFRAEDWLSCDGDQIRQLSTVGKQRAAATGAALRALGVPVSKVWASPYCRTQETARQMNLGQVTPTNDVINLRVADYFGGRAAVIATAQALLATQPEGKTNAVIVAHGNVAQAATPIYPGEGEGVVFQPDGQGGFHFVGRLTHEDWLRLHNAYTLQAKD